jgi:hypothetical protein
LTIGRRSRPVRPLQLDVARPSASSGPSAVELELIVRRQPLDREHLLLDLDSENTFTPRMMSMSSLRPRMRSMRRIVRAVPGRSR